VESRLLCLNTSDRIYAALFMTRGLLALPLLGYSTAIGGKRAVAVTAAGANQIKRLDAGLDCVVGEQHGALISVGFDLYCQLLANAVQEMRGEEPVEDILPAMDIPVTAMIPQEYIPGEAERIFFYKRMSGVRSVGDVEGLHAELEDRFGIHRGLEPIGATRYALSRHTHFIEFAVFRVNGLAFGVDFRLKLLFAANQKFFASN